MLGDYYGFTSTKVQLWLGSTYPQYFYYDEKW